MVRPEPFGVYCRHRGSRRAYSNFSGRRGAPQESIIFGRTPMRGSGRLRRFVRRNSITAKSTASHFINPSSRCRAKVPSTSALPHSQLSLSVPNDCPHDLFRESSRASQIPNFVNRNRLIVVGKENFAIRTAALIIPTVGDNRLADRSCRRQCRRGGGRRRPDPGAARRRLATARPACRVVYTGETAI